MALKKKPEKKLEKPKKKRGPRNPPVIEDFIVPESMRPPSYNIGRPTQYKVEYCQQLIDFMAKGFNITSFAGQVSVSRQTLDSWFNLHPDFLDARKIGAAKLELFYEQKGQFGMLGLVPNFNATTFVWMTKNTIGWRDNQHITAVTENLNTNINHDPVDLSALPDEELRQYLDLTQKLLINQPKTTEATNG